MADSGRQGGPVPPIQPSDRPYFAEKSPFATLGPEMLANVKRDLEEADVGMLAFLTYEIERTTAPQRLQNPAGFYRNLARKLAKKRNRAVLETMFAITAPVDDVKETPRCHRCGGGGMVLEHIEGQRPRQTDQYCDCQMGRDIKDIERRKADTKKVPTAKMPPELAGSPTVVMAAAAVGGLQWQ